MVSAVLNKSNGANFYLADLHIHTPKDKNFTCPKGLNLNSPEGRKSLAEGYIKSAQEKGIKILGITEHNDVSWIEEIREAAKNTDITVFPGFEVSADSGAGGIHIIVLFEPNVSVTFLDDLITQLGLPRNARFLADGSSKLIKKNLDELVNFITDNGGICIAAHVLRDHGILNKESMVGEPRVNAWANEKLLAAEVNEIRLNLAGFAKNVFENTLDLYKRKRGIAAIYFSDARSLDEIGNRATWIKVSSKTLNGLKHAFLDWESRIRHPEEFIQKHFSKIIYAEWSGGFLDGLKVNFNDNLNCLIGGKGTGKSTVLETLRFAFGAEFCPKAEKAKEQHEEILTEVFKKGSRIKVVVEAHHPIKKRYIIERTYNDPPIVKDENGDLLSKLKPCDIIAIESYGQKEIYEISKNTLFQLRLVDKFLGDQLDKLLDEEKTLISQIGQNKTEYLNLKKEIDGLNEKIGRLPKLEEELKKYKESGLPEKIAQKSKYEQEQQYISQVQGAIDTTKKNIGKIKEKIAINDPFPSAEELEGLPNKKLLMQLKVAIKKGQDDLEALRKQMEVFISSIEDSVSNESKLITDWQALYDDEEKKYQELIKQLGEEFAGIDPDDFIEKQNEVNKLRPLKTTKGQKDKELEDISKKRKELLTQLYENRRQQFTVRDRTCKDITERLNGILRVAVEYEGDRVNFVEYLKGLKSGAQQLEKLAENNALSVPSFVDAVRQGSEKVSGLFGITVTSASKICDALKEEKLLELETHKIETKTSIELNVGTKEKPKYQSTKNLSVGQKCTAILTLILLESCNPLMIDQPEDDLDNTFIFSDIVQKLRREKEKRQFIIATHNANIPVLGDSELICVLTADADHGGIEAGHFGSIDDQSVRKPVETILEGGREAFQLRKDKYGF